MIIIKSGFNSNGDLVFGVGNKRYFALTTIRELLDGLAVDTIHRLTDNKYFTLENYIFELQDTCNLYKSNVLVEQIKFDYSIFTVRPHWLVFKVEKYKGEVEYYPPIVHDENIITVVITGGSTCYLFLNHYPPVSRYLDNKIDFGLYGLFGPKYKPLNYHNNHDIFDLKFNDSININNVNCKINFLGIRPTRGINYFHKKHIV